MSNLEKKDEVAISQESQVTPLQIKDSLSYLCIENRDFARVLDNSLNKKGLPSFEEIEQNEDFFTTFDESQLNELKKIFKNVSFEAKNKEPDYLEQVNQIVEILKA